MLEKILSADFKGNGLEFGALHNPVIINNNDHSMKYADRLSKSEAIANFPELVDSFDSIVESDFIVDLDTDDLSFVQGFDFLIANHVIEHVVNPIRFLKNLNNNLKSGGRVLLTVPNKDYTHDCNRDLTRIRSLFIKYFFGTKSLSDGRIVDYLENKLPVVIVPEGTVNYFKKHGLPLSYYENNVIPSDRHLRKKLFDYHRSRSIHVHVWNRFSFDAFLRTVIRVLKLDFSIDHYLPSEFSPGEMIYILIKN